MTTPDAFLRGKLVDKNGLPPLTATLSVLTEGSCQGQRGFVRVRGDHRLDSDGIFTSPPLIAGRYFLRFFGALQDDRASRGNAEDRQRRVFDFVYPGADTVSEALPIDLPAGETLNSVLNVPEPIWFNLAGRIIEGMPDDDCRLSILFQRDMEILPDVGATGIPVKGDGSFEGMLLRGSYTASLHEMTDAAPDAYTRSVRRFGSAQVIIEEDALKLELAMR